MRIPLAFAAVSLAVLGGCSSHDDAANNAATSATMAANDDLVENATAAPNSAPNAAADFMALAGGSDLFETESSKLALDKSQNADVKQFAQMMIDDHAKTTQGVKDAAAKAGLTPPAPQLSPEQQQMLDQLKNLSGADFNKAYLAQQLPAHQKALALMTNYSLNGDTPALKNAATTAVPIVQHHLERVRELAK